MKTKTMKTAGTKKVAPAAGKVSTKKVAAGKRRPGRPSVSGQCGLSPKLQARVSAQQLATYEHVGPAALRAWLDRQGAALDADPEGPKARAFRDRQLPLELHDGGDA